MQQPQQDFAALSTGILGSWANAIRSDPIVAAEPKQSAVAVFAPEGQTAGKRGHLTTLTNVVKADSSPGTMGDIAENITAVIEMIEVRYLNNLRLTGNE